MTTITWTCPVCNHDTTVQCTPFLAAQTYGPPEHCYPSEGPDIDPDNCAHCDAPIDIGEATEQASEQDAADEEYYESLKEDED